MAAEVNDGLHRMQECDVPVTCATSTRWRPRSWPHHRASLLLARTTRDPDNLAVTLDTALNHIPHTVRC